MKSRILRPVFWFIDAIRADRSPSQIAAGLVLGMWVGLTEWNTLHGVLLLALLPLLRINWGALGASALFFWALGYFAHDVLDSLGLYVLTRAPSMRRFWAGLFHAPIIPFTRFHESDVMGAGLVASALSLPLFQAARVAMARWGRRMTAAIADSPVGSAWLTSTLHHYYLRENAGRAVDVAAPTAPAEWRDWVRPQGLIPVATLTAGGLVAMLCVAEGQLKYWVERYLSHINGAQVSIGSADIRWLDGEIELRDMQIAHHVQLMRNLLAIERIHVKVVFPALLRKKIHVEEARLEGIHYGSPRATAAEVPPEVRQGNAGASIVDRVASRFFSDIRDELQENPLRNLSRLALGMDLGAQLDNRRNDLKSVARLAELHRRLDELGAKWAKHRESAPTLHAVEQLKTKLREAPSRDIPQTLRPEVEATWTALQEAMNVIRDDSAAIERDARQIDELLAEDVAKQRALLGLPRTDVEDLSSPILGPKVLNFLERVGYWIDLSRRRMPPATDTADYTLNVRQTPAGTNAHFGKRSTQPAFLVRRIVIKSEPGDSPTRGRVDGLLEGIASDPPLYAKPATGRIRAEFPGAGIRGIDAEFTIDHTGVGYDERLRFHADELPITGWNLTESGDVAIAFEKAKVRADIQFHFQNDRILGSGELLASEVAYTVGSPYKQLQESVGHVLAPLTRFDVKAQLSGPLEKPKLELQSELGRRFASGLRDEYRTQLLAVDDTLRQHLLDRIDPSRRELLSRLEDVTQRALSGLAVVERELAELSASVQATGRTARKPR